MNISYNIYRYRNTSDKQERYQTYEVPYEEGMTILDVIFYVHHNLDATLAFRYECRQGICGTCGVMVNGVSKLSCSTQVDSSLTTQTIEPLAHFPVEKDLIVDLAPILQKFVSIKPYIDKIQKVTVTKEEANKSKPFCKCIECGCCIAASDRVEEQGEDLLDPMSLVKIARFVTDPRDGSDRRQRAKDGGIDKYSQKEAQELARICPRGIPIDEAIRLLQGE